MPLIDLHEKFNEIKNTAESVQFADVMLTEEFKRAFDEYISTNAANGYAEVVWATYSTKIITSSGKSIFLPNYWFYLASELAQYLEGLATQKNLFKEIFHGQNFNEIAIELRGGIGNERKQEIRKFLDDKSYTDNDIRNFERFVSDYSSWGGGKTIDRDDYYISPLMKAGNLLAETQSAVAEIAKIFYQAPELRKMFHATFMSSNTRASEKNETKSVLVSDKSIGKFVYGLFEYLFSNNCYLPLFEKLIEKSLEHGSYNLEHNGHKLTSIFKASETELNEDKLTSGDKLRYFVKPFHHESKCFYLSNQWTNGTDSRLDIQTLKTVFNDLYDQLKIIYSGDFYILSENNHLDTVNLPKPFILLAGISGTGKTRFVRKQAAAYELDGKNFCLVPVRPDWHEPSDLLGYVSRIGGKPEYVTTKVLQFIIDAWKAIAPNADKNGMGELDYSSPPYWLCLDEMNLAPVEQYFADYLSVLESREFNDGEYHCDPLLDKSVLSTKGANVQGDLKLDDDQNLWEFFLEAGISIPPNLIVAGTVNMDETTHGFSRKVIDRALTIDFGGFYPNDYKKFFNGQHKPKILTYSFNTKITPSVINCPVDAEGETTIEFLTAVNELLKKTPFELAYRALNELLLHVSCFAPETPEQLQAVWDDFLMTKVLPRIDGDEDKLRITDKNGAHNLLDKLETLLSVQLKDIWAEDKTRIDLLRVQHDDKPINDEACRSRVKIRWMKDRLDANTFTSFWP